MVSEEVVVEATTQFRKDEATGLIVGRHPEFNLYAHGRVHAEVMEMLKRGFYAWVAVHRERDSLVEALRDTGARWWTREEADRQGIVYEREETPRPKLRRLEKLAPALPHVDAEVWSDRLCYVG